MSKKLIGACAVVVGVIGGIVFTGGQHEESLQGPLSLTGSCTGHVMISNPEKKGQREFISYKDGREFASGTGRLFPDDVEFYFYELEFVWLAEADDGTLFCPIWRCRGARYGGLFDIHVYTVPDLSGIEGRLTRSRITLELEVPHHSQIKGLYWLIREMDAGEWRVLDLGRVACDTDIIVPEISTLPLAIDAPLGRRLLRTYREARSHYDAFYKSHI